jgi:hypothetical protein
MFSEANVKAVGPNCAKFHAYVIEHSKDKLAFPAKVDQDYFRLCSVSPTLDGNAAQPTGVPPPGFKYRPSKKLSFVSPPASFVPRPKPLPSPHIRSGTKHRGPRGGKNPRHKQRQVRVA